MDNWEKEFYEERLRMFEAMDEQTKYSICQYLQAQMEILKYFENFKYFTVNVGIFTTKHSFTYGKN